jgi:hypothetical protein
VDNCNGLLADTISNEMFLNGDVFHFAVGMRVMSTHDSSLIITKDGGW